MLARYNKDTFKSKGRKYPLLFREEEEEELEEQHHVQGV
tara:strand:+ start:720 stop:836 length:117 start_codon:yes stop_codon:yes gene_type:complete